MAEQPPPEKRLVCDTRVRIVNLVSAAQYNNKVGVVLSFQPDTGRYQVELKNNKKKQLAVKREKLIVLCSKAGCKKEASVAAVCPRCELPYCSSVCQESHWKDTHKAKCIPLDISDPPEPNLDGDTGDPNFEITRKYLDDAAEAGMDGRYAEELYMLEALVAKNHQQPAVFFNLFQRYSDTNPDEAFFNLQKAVYLMLDPRMQPASDPQGVDLFPTNDQSLPTVTGYMIRCSVDFVENHIVGRHGNDLSPDAQLLEQLLLLADQINDTTAFDNYARSNLHRTLGNVYRKINNVDQALYHLQMSDTVAQSEGMHNYESLLLIPEIKMGQVVKLAPGQERQEQMQHVVDLSRQVYEQMCSERNPMSYQAAMLLATMLHNQTSADPSKRTQEQMVQVNLLANEGRQTAMRNGDERGVARAQRLLDCYSTR